MDTRPGTDRPDWAELDPWALHFDIGGFLASFPGAETVIAQLNRLLHEFLGGEVLALADQAAAIGVDPTPLLGVVAELLRRYADALERPHDAES